MSTSTRPKAKCSRDNCSRVAMSRGLCKHHYPIAYPAHLRGDVDSTRAREHIAALRARGVTIRMLLDQHGIYDSVVHRIERGERKIRRYTEAQILAIPIPTVWAATLADVDATGTHRRIRALAAIGYTQEDIGARIGVIQRHIAGILGRDKVSAATAAKVAKVFDELHLTPGPSEIARRRAKLKGWAPPLAWDDDTIDDPAAQPDIGKTRTLSFRERYLELVELGYSDMQIADKLGQSLKSVERQLYRFGRRPRRPAAPGQKFAS